jgi:uncharacterized protein YqjF (DUF2071 family)
MLNYEAPPELLQPFVPAGTELDSWNGKTFVTMVGFLFLKTRVLGVPVPAHQNFEEINLRFYVRRRGPEGWRRGVVFIKEIVPRWAIAAIARIFYNEKYVALPTRHEISLSSQSLKVAYRWRWKNRWHSLSAITTGAAALVAPGSLEEFITEHYWGYSSQKNGGCVEYQVKHPSWKIWQTASAAFECEVEELYGAAFAESLSQKPVSAFVAEGSDVTVYRGIKI